MAAEFQLSASISRPAEEKLNRDGVGLASLLEEQRRPPSGTGRGAVVERTFGPSI